MEALDQLGRKLDLLLKKYTAMEAENKKLQDTIVLRDRALEEVGKKLAALESGVASANLANVVTGDAERDNMRKQLDQVITEIDKILHTLND